MHTSYGDRVRFVGVNAIDSIDKMSAFAGERGVTYELYQDPTRRASARAALDVISDDVVRRRRRSIVERTGVLDESRLETEVIELLAAES